MNKMTEVAKILGVEIGEEFEIDGDPYEWVFVEKGLHIKSNETFLQQEYMLSELLAGNRTIAKKPFRPKYGEDYYIISFDHFDNNWRVCAYNNYNCNLDLANIATGNCFRTKQEAEQNKQAIIDLLSPYIAEVENERD